METERITLSQRERDRMRVLHEVKQGHLTQREAGKRLGLSDRQVRRLLLRLVKHGDQAMIHGLRWRGSTASKRPITSWKRAFSPSGRSGLRWHRVIPVMPIDGWGANIVWKKF